MNGEDGSAQATGRPRPLTLGDWLGAGAAGGATGGLVAAVTGVLLMASAGSGLGPVVGAGLAFTLFGVLLGAAVGAIAGLVLGAMAGGLGRESGMVPSRWRLGMAGAAIQVGALVVAIEWPALMQGPSTSGPAPDWRLLLLLGVPGGVLGGLVAAWQLRRTTDVTE